MGLCLTVGAGLNPFHAFSHPIVNLKSPQSFIVDPVSKEYFIANANGEPGKRDNNGFISRLTTEGEMKEQYFIEGGKRNAVLHSPAGMAIVKNSLFVADLEAIRVFQADTGDPIDSISLARFGTSELSGVTANSQGTIYVADTKGNAIFRIDPHNGNALSLFIQDKNLAGPHGLAIHPRSGNLMVATLDQGTVLEVDSSGSIKEIVSNGFFTSRFNHLSGVDFDQYGTMYVSDITAGKVWRIYGDQKMEVIAEFLISPASLSIDREKHLIMIPYLYANGAEINGLERPANAQRKKKKRTLSDYGLGWLGEDDKQ